MAYFWWKASLPIRALTNSLIEESLAFAADTINLLSLISLSFFAAPQSS